MINLDIKELINKRYLVVLKNWKSPYDGKTYEIAYGEWRQVFDSCRYAMHLSFEKPEPVSFHVLLQSTHWFEEHSEAEIYEV